MLPTLSLWTTCGSRLRPASTVSVARCSSGEELSSRHLTGWWQKVEWEHALVPSGSRRSRAGRDFALTGAKLLEAAADVDDRVDRGKQLAPERGQLVLHGRR